MDKPTLPPLRELYADDENGVSVLGISDNDIAAYGEAMAAWGAAQERESKDAQRGRSARMRAAGMASLLSEAIGAGALRFHFDDLKERMEMAIADQERAAQGD